MILGGETQQTKGSPLARMDQLQRIDLSRYSEYPQYFPLLWFKNRFDLPHITYCVESQWIKIFAPIFSKGIDPGFSIERKSTSFVQPQRNALHLDGAKSHMSDRYFDWNMDCFKHILFQRTPEFFEELAIKMNKSGSELDDVIMGIITNIVQIQVIQIVLNTSILYLYFEIESIYKCLEKKKRNKRKTPCFLYVSISSSPTIRTLWIGQILLQIPFLEIPLRIKGKGGSHSSYQLGIPYTLFIRFQESILITYY